MKTARFIVMTFLCTAGLVILYSPDAVAIMKEEIRKRLSSNAWNHDMAARVMKRKHPNTRFLPHILAFAAAAAALFVFVFLPGAGDIAAPRKYDQFVKLQVRGTYDDVFESGLKGSLSSGEGRMFISSQVSGTYGDVFQKDPGVKLPGGAAAEIISAGDVDSLIDDVLVMR